MTDRPIDGTDAVRGLWRREWLRTPAGRDDATRVLWMQADELHVDLRIPAALAANDPVGGSTDRPANRTDPGYAERLRQFASCEGFAGTTRVSEGVCTWTRRINFRGPPRGIDTGTLRFEPEGLFETGIHDDYEELWTHESAEAPAGLAMTSADGQRLVVLWTSERFALGRGRPADMAPGSRSLDERVGRALDGGDEIALAAAFDQEFCTGDVRDGAAVIEHSTLPGRRGAVALDVARLSPTTAELNLSVADAHGARSAVRFQLE